MKGERQAFSLIEVVLAVAIFATCVLVIAGSIGSSPRAASDLADQAAAARLVEEVRLELMRRRDSLVRVGGNSRLDQLAEEIGVTGLRLVADRAGRLVRLESAVEGPQGIARRDRFFLIQVDFLSGALAHRPGAGFLALSVMILWPYWVPIGPGENDAVATPPGSAASLRVNLALSP